MALSNLFYNIPIYRYLQEHPTLKNLLLLTGIAVLNDLVYALCYRFLGFGASAMMFLFVVLVGYFFGLKAGIIAGILIPMLDLAGVIHLIGRGDVGKVIMEEWGARFAALLLVGIVVGRKRDLHLRLEKELAEKKKIEASEKEQRILAETLRDVAKILNSTLGREEVLDQILDQIGRVVPYDTVNLMLIEADIAQVVRCRGYLERGLQEPSLAHRLVVNDTKNLRRMAETGKPQAISDTRVSEEWVNLPGSGWIHSYAGTPMSIKGRTVGYLNVNSATPGLYNQEHADRLQAFAEHAALAIDNARLFYEVKQLAYTDELTGLYNRRGVTEVGRREFERSNRYDHKLSIVMLDIDHFKLVNDTFGHSVGDRVLELIGERFRMGLRWSDIVGRYGGEEFLILLPEADLTGALVVAERLRTLISGEPYRLEEGELNLTVSLGVAMMDSSLTDLEALIKRADNALYLAKQAGRDRVMALNGNPHQNEPVTT